MPLSQAIPRTQSDGTRCKPFLSLAASRPSANPLRTIPIWGEFGKAPRPIFGIEGVHGGAAMAELEEYTWRAVLILRHEAFELTLH